MKILLTLLGISSKTEDRVPSITALKGNFKGQGLKTWITRNYPNAKILSVPNIKEFKIELGLFDPLLLLNGLLRRIDTKLDFGKPNRNGQMNRYLLYMTAKLLKLRIQPEKYWNYSYWFLTNSNSFLLSSL
jgi:hypothetical protein